MNSELLLQGIIEDFKKFEFESAHVRFISIVERLLAQLSQEDQGEIAQLLTMYEEAYTNQDVIRICDLIKYFVIPLSSSIA